MANAFFANWRQNIIYIGFVVIFIVFAVTLADKGFLNPNNLLNIVRQTAMIAVMAIAMTFVLSAGEIDLSVGAVAGLSTVTVAMAIAAGGPIAGVGAGIATGLAVGMFNGERDEHPTFPFVIDAARTTPSSTGAERDGWRSR